MHKISSNKPDTLLVTWDVTSKCNFNCSYCPSELHDGKYGFPSYDDIIYFINQLSEKTDDIFLELVGGEPTLWPKLIDFLKEIQEYSNVTTMILTNGSRTNSWWKKYDAANLHMKTVFVFSFHHEQCDPDLYYSNLEIISKRHNVVSMMLIDPNRYEYIKELGDRIQASLPVTLLYKPIRKQMHYTELLDGFTDEMFSLINRDPKENLFDKTKFKKESNKIVWPTRIFIDDVAQNWQTILVEGKHSFKGWKCSAGSKRFYIDFKGDVLTCSEARQFSTEFKEKYKLGNINQRNTKILDSFVTCPVNYCPCKMDALAEKFKV